MSIGTYDGKRPSEALMEIREYLANLENVVTEEDAGELTEIGIYLGELQDFLHNTETITN